MGCSYHVLVTLNGLNQYITHKHLRATPVSHTAEVTMHGLMSVTSTLKYGHI